MNFGEGLLYRLKFSGKSEARQNAALLWLVFIGALVCSGAWAGGRWYIHRAPINRDIAIGKAALKGGQYPAAEAAWRRALAADPTRAEPYSLLGDLYLQTGRTDQATLFFNRLSQIDPRFPNAFGRLAEAYAKSGNHSKALDIARKAVIVEPKSATAHAVLGIELSNQQQHPKAIAELTIAHRLAPANDLITLSVAQAELNAANLAGAVQSIQSVLKRDPKNVDAYSLLGQVYLLQAREPAYRTKAKAAFTRVLELDPGNTGAAGELGILNYEDHQFLDAATELRQAWDGGMKTPEIAGPLIAACRKIGDIKEAARITSMAKRMRDLVNQDVALGKKLAANPHDTDAAIELSLIKLQEGDLNDAGELISAVLTSGRRDPAAMRAAAEISRAASLAAPTADGSRGTTRQETKRPDKRGIVPALEKIND